MDVLMKTKEQIQVELEQIDDAIKKLQSGERIVNVSYNGHSVTYASIELNELLAQRSRLQGLLGEPAKRQIIFATHKGVK
jgi:hypothetical protein